MSYRITTDKTWARILDDLEETFRKWPVRDWKVDCALPANRVARKLQTLEERLVTVIWWRKDRRFELRMARQDRAVDNLLVLQLVIEALRLNDKRGIAETLAEAYRQEYPALPAPGGVHVTQAEATAATPYQRLSVLRSAPIEVCEAAYRALAKKAHPDAGGSVSEMAQLTAAIEAIRKERGT